MCIFVNCDLLLTEKRLYIFMKKRYILIFFLFAGILFRIQDSYAEGSKQIWIGTYWSYLSICTDFVTHCGWTNFAAYGCDETSRLYFVTKNTNEIVYFGFQLGTLPLSGTHCVFRIKDLSGNIVYPETNVPTGGTGYIDFISEARIGPIQIYGTGGYIASDWHPPAADTYYMEFQVLNNATDSVTPCGFSMELFDLTVYDSVAQQVMPGRLYSKAWEFEENDNYSGTIYLYSPDSIITSVAANNMAGGIWDTYCNQWGCANTGNFASDRKSRHNQDAYLPEYPVFLNPPDSTIFPPAKLFGQIVSPDPWGETNCSNGNIVFHVYVNKAAGTIEIDLSFPNPYTNRILTRNSVSGENLLTWNGLDGSGVIVPNNILVTYMIKYENGLTNLPLFDVEGNDNGFIIGLVSPAGNTPLVYWDDTNIPQGTMNLTGCLSPPGCHPWSDAGYGFGNNNTVNTWWYVVSDSTDPATIVEKRAPPLLVFNQSPPQSFCGDTTGVYYSVTADPTTEIYNWNYTGTGVTIHHLNPSDNFVTLDFAANATSGNLTVYGTNANCPGGGPTSSLAITFAPAPIMDLPYSGTLCSGNTTSILLTSTPPGATFSWTTPAPTCSANITSCPTGQNNATQITDILSLSDNNTGTVTYHITPMLSQCNGPVQDYMMTVNPPSPVSVTISASQNPICAGNSVTFTATPVNGGASPSYQWKVNGIIAGTNSTIFTYIPLNADIVSCLLTSSNTTCTSNNPASSNQLFMVINSYSVVDISITASSNPFCQGGSVTFTATPTNGGANPAYQWKVNGINIGPNNPVYSYSPNNGDVVSCVLTSNIACPIGNPATSNPITMIVNSNLPAAINITASTNPFCPGNSVTYTAATINGGPTPFYQWKVNGVIAGTNSSTFVYNPVSGDLVTCILTSNLPCVTANPATSNTIIMNGNLAPVVTFTHCNDSITTTNAQPFKLKGGIPLGGSYSGLGVTNGIFYSAIAGVGNHQINYTYTNAALCSASAIVTIVTIGTVVTNCGQTLTDVRDGKTYPTVQIGSQCWMAEDLNYGTEIPSTQHQRDNCIAEKYHNPASGIGHPASVYQWDEIMNYDESISTQGLCPPGWHVPSESDWNTLFVNYINNGFAASPLKYSGFSGFNALLSGVRHLNKTWDYQGFATFFWSSTAHGTTKAWVHGMNEADPSVSAYPAYRSNAFSVRCLKD